jgi:hypothetical protein
MMSDRDASDGYKTYKTRDFIRKNEQGALDLERSLELVKELAAAAGYHSGYNILIDLRQTEPLRSFTDTLTVAMEFARYQDMFRNKIAVLIPDNEKRIERAEFFRTGLGTVSFKMSHFTVFEEAIEWLSQVADFR